MRECDCACQHPDSAVKRMQPVAGIHRSSHYDFTLPVVVEV